MGGSIPYTLRYTEKSDILAFDNFLIRYAHPWLRPLYNLDVMSTPYCNSRIHFCVGYLLHRAEGLSCYSRLSGLKAVEKTKLKMIIQNGG